MVITAAAFTPAAAPAQAGLSPGQIGLSITAVGLIAGIAIAMHHKKKSPRIIGWLCFLIGIPLAGLLSGPLAALGGISLWTIPVAIAVTGYIAFVFFHDGFKRKSGGFGGSGGGGAHRWLQPIFGLILPALIFMTIGGSLGNAAHQVLGQVNGTVGTTVSHVTGR